LAQSVPHSPITSAGDSTKSVRRVLGSTAATLAVITTLVLIVGLGFLSSEKSIAGKLGFSSDDAWIHFRFAQNLISGHGFSYNLDHPVAGSTAPLWTLFCAVFLAVIGEPVLAGKVAGFLAWVFLVFGVHRLVGGLTRSAVAAWCAALLTLLHQRVVWGALSGLEVILYSALVVWALHLHFQSRESHRIPYLVVTILLVLGGLTRPELLCLVPLFWLDRWWLNPSPEQTPAARRRQIAVSAMAAMALLLPWLAFDFWTIGRLLPLTFYAKVSPHGIWAALASGQIGEIARSIFVDSFGYLRETYVRFLFTEIPGMVGVWYLVWNLGSMPLATRRTVRLLMIIPFYYLVVTALLGGGLQGAFGRYLMFVFPLFCVIAVIATWQWLTNSRRSHAAVIIGSATLAIILLVALMRASWGLPLTTLFWIGFYPHTNYMPESVQGALNGSALSALRTIAFCIGPALACGLAMLWLVRSMRIRRWSAGVLWGAWALLVTLSLPGWATVCSRAVANTNDLNVAAGMWLDTYLPVDATIAVNDIGAIGYFAGRRHIYDLMGLVEPDILPYRLRGEEGIWNYVEQRRPDYLAVFDTWFPSIVKRTDVFEPIRAFHADNYILWGYHTLSVYRAHWDTLGTR
jgi:hypothetical protein